MQTGALKHPDSGLDPAGDVSDDLDCWIRSEMLFWTKKIHPRGALISSIAEKKKKARQLSTLPHNCSTIDVRVLNFRVRDGNGCVHSAMATGPA